MKVTFTIEPDGTDNDLLLDMLTVILKAQQTTLANEKTQIEEATKAVEKAKVKKEKEKTKEVAKVVTTVAPPIAEPPAIEAEVPPPQPEPEPEPAPAPAPEEPMPTVSYDDIREGVTKLVQKYGPEETRNWMIAELKVQSARLLKEEEYNVSLVKINKKLEG